MISVGVQYVLVGSAFALSSTAFLPLCGGLAVIFGRRLVMLSVLGFFMAGSAVCGAAQSLNMLIAGRCKLDTFQPFDFD
jgi:MFS family permease